MFMNKVKMNNEEEKDKNPKTFYFLTSGLSLKKKLRLHANFFNSALYVFHVEHGIERKFFRKKKVSINIIVRRVEKLGGRLSSGKVDK